MSGPERSGPRMGGAVGEHAESAWVAYQYCVLRLVPLVERNECLNVGVLLYCQSQDLLQAAHHIDAARISAAFPGTDVDDVSEAVEWICRVAQGAHLHEGQQWDRLGKRFGWLTAPRSTIIQPGPVHGAVTRDLGGELERLIASQVRTTV